MSKTVAQLVPLLVQLRPSALAAFSQLLGLAQFVLLLRGLGAGAPSDAYIYIYTWSLLPIHIVLLGVVYPLWVRGRKFTNRFEQWIFASLAISVQILALAGAVILILLGKNYDELMLHCLLLSLQAALSVYGWAAALRIASSGRSDWLSSVTLLPSLFACVLLVLVPSDSLAVRVTILCTGLVCGALTFVIALALFRPDSLSTSIVKVPKTGLGDAVGGRYAAAWFGAKSVTGFGSGIALQSLAATLAPAALTTVGIASRLVGGFSTVVTNTILPRLIHSESDSASSTIKYSWVMVWGSAACALSFSVLSIFIPIQYFSWGMVVISWILAASVSASMQRVASKFFPASLSIVSISIALAVPIFLLFFALNGILNFKLVLGAYCFIDLSIGVTLCGMMRKYLLGFATILVAGLCLGIGLVLFV